MLKSSVWRRRHWTMGRIARRWRSLSEFPGPACIGDTARRHPRRSREQQTSQAAADIRPKAQRNSAEGSAETLDSRGVGLYSFRDCSHVRDRRLRRELWRLAQVLTMTTERKMGGGRLRRGSRQEQRRRRAPGGSALGCWLPSDDCGTCRSEMTPLHGSRRAERSEGLHDFLPDVTGRGRKPIGKLDRPNPLPPSLRPTPGCTE